MTKIYPLFVVAIMLVGVGAQWPELLQLPTMANFENDMRAGIGSIIDTMTNPIDFSDNG